MKPETKKAIIFFDGICNLCNSSVQFILKHDTKHHFVFAALQSDVAKDILLQYPEEITKKDSILLVQNKKVYSESTAALLIAKEFKGFWKLLQFFWVIPKFLRNAVYRLIAKKRYHWFGRRDSCMIPSKENSQRFL